MSDPYAWTTPAAEPDLIAAFDRVFGTVTDRDELADLMRREPASEDYSDDHRLARLPQCGPARVIR